LVALRILIFLFFVDAGAGLAASADGRPTRWLLLFDHPVEDKVVFVTHPVEEVFEQFAQVPNVGLLFELERPAVV